MADGNRLPAAGLEGDQGGYAHLEAFALHKGILPGDVEHVPAVELGREPLATVQSVKEAIRLGKGVGDTRVNPFAVVSIGLKR